MAKYWTIFIIIALFLSAIITYQLAKDPSYYFPLEEMDTDVSPDITDLQNWKEFTAPENKFTVLFPSTPQHATENIKDQNTGEMRKYDMYLSETMDGTIYMISLIKFKEPIQESEKEKLLRTMMNDMMESNPNNEILTMNATEFKGKKALDFSFMNPELKIDTKTFVEGDTLYVLSRVDKTKNSSTNDYTFFINSFEMEPIE